MDIVTDKSALRATVAEWKRSGARVGFVPTMGFLHAGHLRLMEHCRTLADKVVVSIFVNPTQFGPNEDLSRYPRDPDGDLRKCAEVGVDLLFTPEPATMYPPGFQTYVEVRELQQQLADALLQPDQVRVAGRQGLRANGQCLATQLVAATVVAHCHERGREVLQ